MNYNVRRIAANQTYHDTNFGDFVISSYQLSIYYRQELAAILDQLKFLQN